MAIPPNTRNLGSATNLKPDGKKDHLLSSKRLSEKFKKRTETSHLIIQQTLDTVLSEACFPGNPLC